MPDVIQIAIQATDAASKVIGGVGDSLDKLSKQSDDADKKLKLFGMTTDQIGGKMTAAGKIATVGLTLPIAGLAVAATKAASDLNETSNKIQTLFGNASGAVMKFADTAATSLGQSKKQALDAAADFAVFGKAAGLAGDDLVKFSSQNVKLAADMASFFNTSPEEAITAIGAAFRGESEPIRRYGVLINEASLKDQALRMGLIRTTTEALQPQQRVLAAQALILQQTAAAQGDFAKTSDGLANQSRILNAQFQDMIASLGQSLLPIAVKVAGAANDLLKAFNNLEQPQKDLIVGFGLMAAAAGPVLTIGGKLVSTFGALSKVSIDVGGGLLSMGKTIGETAGYIKQVGVSTDSLRFAFENLKAGGVVLAAEIGVIVAGLKVIIDFIEATGKAANATTDELIKMANSGDFFKQAGASFEIIVNGQNRLNIAVQGVGKSLQEQKVSYDQYRSGVLGAAVAAGTITEAQAKEYIETGKVTDAWYHQIDVTKDFITQTGIQSKAVYESTHGVGQFEIALRKLTDIGNQFATGVVPILTGALGKETDATKDQAAAIDVSIAAIEHADDVSKRYAQTLGVTVNSIKAQKGAIADTYGMAVSYTEAERKQADVQKELDDLNAKIAARGPVRVTNLVAEAKATSDVSIANTALTAARAAADDVAKRDNETSAQYAMRLKDAQTNLNKLTAEMSSHIVTTNASSAADQKSALNQARLAAAQEDLATAQRKKGETDAEFALRVETIKGKIADYSKTLETHTGVVGGATKAELEQKKALEEQIATMQKAGEVEKAKGAFESLTKAFRDGILTEDQYRERASALNAVTNLYTESALKQATAQEVLMQSFSDPASEKWRGQLLKNQDAIDGQINKTNDLTQTTKNATDAMSKAGVPVGIPLTPKTDPASQAAFNSAAQNYVTNAVPVPIAPKTDAASQTAFQNTAQGYITHPVQVPIAPKPGSFDAAAAIGAAGIPIEIPVTPKVTPGAGEDVKNQVKGFAPGGIEIPIKPKIDPTERTKIGRDIAGDLKYAQPTITPKADTKQAVTDITALVTNVYGAVPKEIKTTPKVDTVIATRSTNDLLKLFGQIPKEIKSVVNVDGGYALQTLDDVIRTIGKIVDKTVTILVKYKTEGEKPTGYQFGGSMIVPPNPSGKMGDYFPILAAPGERVTVQTAAQQHDTRTPYAAGGDTYNYTTNIFNPMSAAMWADQQRRERVARSNARMGVT